MELERRGTGGRLRHRPDGEAAAPGPRLCVLDLLFMTPQLTQDFSEAFPKAGFKLTAPRTEAELDREKCFRKTWGLCLSDGTLRSEHAHPFPLPSCLPSPHRFKHTLTGIFTQVPSTLAWVYYSTGKIFLKK